MSRDLVGDMNTDDEKIAMTRQQRHVMVAVPWMEFSPGIGRAASSNGRYRKADRHTRRLY